MCGDISCNVFLLLFMTLCAPICATLCMREVLMLWHAFLFLGLGRVGFFPASFFLLGGLHCFSKQRRKSEVDGVKRISWVRDLDSS
jgi:hypothetical protein